MHKSKLAEHYSTWDMIRHDMFQTNTSNIIYTNFIVTLKKCIEKISDGLTKAKSNFPPTTQLVGIKKLQ